MYTNSILAVSGALLSAVAAVPMADQHHHHHHHHPARDYVYVPHLEVVYETIAITETVWVDATQPTPEINPEPPAPEAPKPAETTPVNPPAPPAYIPPPPPPPAPSSTTPPPPPPPAYTPEPSSSTPVYVAPPAPTAPAYVPPPPPTYPEPAPEAPHVEAPPAPAPPAPAPPAESPPVKSSGSDLSGMAAPGTSYTGDLTWYDVGLGACGKTNTKDQPVVAIPEAIFDAYTKGNPNLNPLCGATVTITGKDGSKHTAEIVDRCPGCTKNDLDLSQDFFNKVTDYGDGRVGGMEWCFD